MHVTKLSQLLATHQNHSIRCTVYLKPYFGYYYIYQGNVEHSGASVSKLYIEASKRFIPVVDCQIDHVILKVGGTTFEPGDLNNMGIK